MLTNDHDDNSSSLLDLVLQSIAGDFHIAVTTGKGNGVGI